jgi:hypothetical protein
MSNGIPTPNHYKRGASALPVVLGILLATLAVYLVYKVQGLEARVQKVEDVISGLCVPEVFPYKSFVQPAGAVHLDNIRIQ